jgi:hypothetical protein
VLGYPAVRLTVPWDGAAAAYGPTLCEVLLAPSLPLPTRQLAGMALKRLVAQHWTPLDGEHAGWTLADEVRRATPLCPLHRPLLTSLRMATSPPHPSTRRPCVRWLPKACRTRRRASVLLWYACHRHRRHDRGTDRGGPPG